MQPGQLAFIKVDAFPKMPLRGHVDSFQRGTGSNFALLPPENATGNFVKVVQRIPVKIVLDDPPQTLQSISPGMSVESIVSIAEPPFWLRSFLALIGDPAA
jgi:membrane fusion protein (multidrug efflux system)